MSRDAAGNALNRAHRRKYLLSGLLECGLCGGGYTIIDAANYGCATHRSKGTCSNPHRVRRSDLERRVLDGLKHRLLAPERVQRKIASMIRAIEDGMYQPSMKERMAELEAEKTVIKERLA